ncbi:MAG: rhodanese-like domain-containing protein [Thiobacillaceae bacterium]|nr:rhodanese-like domain-containing protein [Thiobacillaceae bacterium]
MKKSLLTALLVSFLAAPLAALAVDPASLPDIKKTRTPEELLFVGVPQGIDGNAPFGIMNYNKWDEKKQTYVRFPNPDFLSQFEYWAMDKGTEKTDPILLICRSGDRSALGADFLAKQGYTNVWSVVDGFEGDMAKEGPNKGRRAVNGWKNIGLPWGYDLDKTRLLLRE